LTTRGMLIGGAVLGALAVASGAFGAHALDGVLSERARGWYDTAVTYHAGHALALLVCGLLSLQVATGRPVAKSAGKATGKTVAKAPAAERETGGTGNDATGGAADGTIDGTTRIGTPLRLAAFAFLAGIALFSGSLYAMAFTGVTRLGMITPLGGLALIVGWIALAVAAARLPVALS